MWSRSVAFVNARVQTQNGEAHSIRFRSRVLSLDEVPRAGDAVVDLQGAFVLPGLVNAHDHLELNHYGRLKFRDRYANVSGWIDDMRPRLDGDPSIRAARAHPLGDRLFIGALKNLLSGVTTVAHHNPFYPELRRRCPIRVVNRYGWAHSFALARVPVGAGGEPGGNVGERYRTTPRDAPFFVHLAEGIDTAARAELEQLERAEALGPNTVLVHGVAIEPADWPHVVRRGAGLVWCPASNLFLFNRTAPVRQFLNRGTAGGRVRIALGTDSRLSGRRDLLEELDLAASIEMASPQELLRMVTVSAADLVGVPSAGRIRAGLPADLLVVPDFTEAAARALLATTRRDVRLVVLGGRPLVGDESLQEVFRARRVSVRPVTVDAAPKLMDAAVAGRIASCPIAEPGVAIGAPGRSADAADDPGAGHEDFRQAVKSR